MAALEAFKSKYTGEQIEELLDVLNSGSLLEPQAGESQYYSTECGNEVFFYDNDVKYTEIKRGIMTFRIEADSLQSGTAMPISAILKETSNSNYYLYFRNGIAYYTFDVPIIPKQLRVKMNSKADLSIYYLINGQYELQKTYTATDTSYNIKLALPTIETTQVKITLGDYAYTHHLILDFVTDEYVTGMTIKDGTL